MVDKPGIYLHGYPDSYKELIEVTMVHANSFIYHYVLSGNENAKYYSDQTWSGGEAHKNSQVGSQSWPGIDKKKEVFELIFGEIVVFNPRRQ